MTIPLILASKSKPRRDILFHAGIRPTIRVSHVDEDAVLARAADERGITVDELPIDTKVMLLAEAKALAVYEAYLAVAKTARELQAVQEAAIELLAHEKGSTFKIDVKRVDKTYPLDS